MLLSPTLLFSFYFFCAIDEVVCSQKALSLNLPEARVFLWGVYVFFLCLHGVSLVTLAPSYSPKMWIDKSVTLN